jgi:hypothetical protein
MDGNKAVDIVTETDIAKILAKLKNKIDKHFGNALCNVTATTLWPAEHNTCKHADVQGDG